MLVIQYRSYNQGTDEDPHKGSQDNTRKAVGMAPIVTPPQRKLRLVYLKFFWSCTK